MNLIAISVIMSVAILSMTAVSIGQEETEAEPQKETGITLPVTTINNPIILYVNEANVIPVSPRTCNTTPTTFFTTGGVDIINNTLTITPTEVTGDTISVSIYLVCGGAEGLNTFYYEVKERTDSQFGILLEPTIEVASFAFGDSTICSITSQTQSINFGKIEVGKISTLNGTIQIDNAVENIRVWSYYVSASDWTFGDDDKVLFDNKYIEVFNPVRLESDGVTHSANWQSLDFEIRNRQQTLPGESSDILFRINLQDATNSDLATINPTDVKGSFGIQGICPSS